MTTVNKKCLSFVGSKFFKPERHWLIINGFMLGL